VKFPEPLKSEKDLVYKARAFNERIVA